MIDLFFFFFNDTATTELYTLSLHDALPTYGRVSRYGLVAFGSSLDQIGVFGRSVHDAARVLSVISGRDPRDSTCEDRDSLRLPTVPESLQGFVIGLPREYFPPELDPAVRRACDRAVRVMKELGAAGREDY